jgi:hypothetical protein
MRDVKRSASMTQPPEARAPDLMRDAAGILLVHVVRTQEHGAAHRRRHAQRAPRKLHDERIAHVDGRWPRTAQLVPLLRAAPTMLGRAALHAWCAAVIAHRAAPGFEAWQQQRVGLAQ